MTKAKRRGHKKSTAGCDVCKKRHLKCDENRPSCVNCITQGRRCPYLDEVPSPGTTAGTNILTPDSAEDSSNTQTARSRGSFTPNASSSIVQLNLPTPWFDLIYIRLVQQWLTKTHQIFAFNSEHVDIYGQMTFNHALAFPFLMHGMLALSALQLSLAHSDDRNIYLQHAEELQSQALATFNSILPTLDKKSIVPAFLFSSITSVHQMCKCFSSPMTDLDGFLDQFIECLGVSRGVNVVLEGWWPFLMESKLRPILSISGRLRREHDVDEHTQEFVSARELIHSFESANSLETTKTYFESIATLQWNFNVQRILDSPELNQSTSWVFAWPMNIPSEFTNLLSLRRPEALVILAHYAPLLHYRRSCWVIGNAGQLMFELIKTHLGVRWSKWLEWPGKAIERR